MDIRVRAGIETAKILGTCAAVGVLVSLAFQFMTVEIFMWLMIISLVGGAVYLCYTNCLRQLRSQEILNELSTKK